MMLLPALNPACSSAAVSSAWVLSLFKIIFSITLLELLMRLMVTDEAVVLAELSFLGSVIISD